MGNVDRIGTCYSVLLVRQGEGCRATSAIFMHLGCFCGVGPSTLLYFILHSIVPGSDSESGSPETVDG